MTNYYSQINELYRLAVKQVAKKCTNGDESRLNTDSYYVQDLIKEQFAKLIVRECVNQIKPMIKQVDKFGPPPGYCKESLELAYKDSINAIKEQFKK
jgi:hypothetical protein